MVCALVELSFFVEQAGKKQGKISEIVPDSDTYYEGTKQVKNNGDWTP